MESIANIVGYLLLFTLAGGGLAGWGVIHVSRLPADNPLRHVLHSVCIRVGVTVGAGIAAVPLQILPGIGEIYDFGAVLALAYFWLTLIREIMTVHADTRQARVAPQRTEQEAPPALTGKIWVAPHPLSERTAKEPMRLRR